MNCHFLSKSTVEDQQHMDMLEDEHQWLDIATQNDVALEGMQSNRKDGPLATNLGLQLPSPGPMEIEV